MRTRFIYYAAASILLAGCAKEELQVVHLNEIQDEYPVFTASMEQVPSTRTYVDSHLHMHWNTGDCITLFSGDAGYQYQFDGEDGDISGTFSFVKKSEYELVSTPLNANYAVFPYSIGAWASSDGALYLELPYIQNYSEGSFGPETNTMVAATDGSEDRVLDFKNIYGYLTLKLYGEGIIKSITLKGNNGEAVAGYASVSLTHGSNPVIEMDQNGAYDSIILDCGEGVTLGRTADTATEFWLCIPPITFSEGFTISVAGTDGCYISKKVSGQHAITRNTVNPMASLEIVFDENNKAVPFDDVDFKAYCVQNFDIDGDGEVSLSEAEAVSEMWVVTDNIESLGGIECFQNLNKLICIGSSSYDSDNDVFISNGTLTSLDISQNTALTQLQCHDNKLDSLDVSNLPLLTDLRCDKNNLKYLNINGNAALQYLSCYNNQLTSLDASNLPELRTLYCYDNKLQQLNVSGDESLQRLYCYNNKLTSIELCDFDNLTYFYCYNNLLSSLEIGGLQSLNSLACDLNENLQSLNVHDCPNLEYIWAGYCQLTSISLSNLPSLGYLECEENYALTILDISECPSLYELYCGCNNISELDLSNNPNLVYLNCEGNHLTSLDVSNNHVLEELNFDMNLLTSIDLSNNLLLQSLFCYQNQLDSLDLSHNTALKEIWCHSNNLSSLDLGENQMLEYLDCSVNQLTSLDLCSNSKLQDLKCDNNLLTSLDVSNNNELRNLDCSPMSTLDTLLIASGQSIPNVTVNRNAQSIPSSTEIVIKGASMPRPEAIDLGLSVKWASFNVGASAPEEYGDYYAWGETNTKTTYSLESYIWFNCDVNPYEPVVLKYNGIESFGAVDGKSSLELSDDAANTVLGNDWRMPTKEEWQELKQECTWTWTTLNGVNGYSVVSNSNGNSIFLPAASGKDDSDISDLTEGEGNYWSSTRYSNIPYYAWEVWFDDRSIYLEYDNVVRCYGLSVRAVQSNTEE